MRVFPSVVTESATPATADPFFMPTPGVLILLIDDDDFIADVIGRLLSRSGHKVLRARNGSEGERLFAAYQLEISVVMLDCGLPDINGLVLHRAFRRQAPVLPVILTSGFESDAARAVEDGYTVFLPKPFFASQAQALITALLGAPTSQRS
jgi:DNA-binding response OmpR family regulator